MNEINSSKYEINDVIPYNRQVVIKYVLYGVSSLAFVNDELSSIKPEMFDYTECYVVNSADEDFKEGDVIMINDFVLQNPGTRLINIVNNLSYKSIYDMVKEFNKSEAAAFAKNTNKLNVVEYFVIDSVDIKCKLKPKVNVIEK